MNAVLQSLGNPLPLTVLHIEDDAAVAEAMRLLLRSSGYRAATATTGEEALSLVEAGLRPDVVIADYQLRGGGTGADAVEGVYRMLGEPLPTIMLSGHLFTSEVPWMPGAPMLLLSKPTDANLLLGAVEHFAQLHRLMSARAGQAAGN